MHPLLPQVLSLGLLDEAAFLLSLGISGSSEGLFPGSMAGKAVGYRQATEWLLEVRVLATHVTEEHACKYDVLRERCRFKAARFCAASVTACGCLAVLYASDFVTAAEPHVTAESRADGMRDAHS